jgi:hypothetical protein
MKLSILEIVEKLIGNTCAIGETHFDEKANENIEVLGQLVYDLVGKLIEIKEDNFDRYEHSRKVNGKKANYILKNIKECLDE